MPPSHAETHYIDVTRRLSRMSNIGAAAISVLMLAATWGRWHAFIVIACVQVALIPFNAAVNAFLLRRWGMQRTELLRTIVNLSGSVIAGHLAGWPFPIWMWQPFVALVFDEMGEGTYWMILAALCAVMDATALLDHQPWIYPASFTAGAVFCALITRARFGAMRAMLGQGAEQRLEIERAHVALQETHDQLTDETAARAQLEGELLHAQKLEAVGRLAAGIAHEINTPVQFVGDSLHFLHRANTDLMELLERHRRLPRMIEDGATPAAATAAMTASEEELDLEFIRDNVEPAFTRSFDGLQRIAAIVRSMKAFAHPDRKEMSAVDLNQAIQDTLTIARGEYKQVADIALDLEPLPLVTCHIGEINQVVLNLLVNAAHAIEDIVRGTAGRGTITVRSRDAGGRVVIAIADTGGGIPDSARERIFEPFFTTKAVGRGSGQGLAIARSVVKGHGGSLRFETAAGAGTTFFLELPIDPMPAQVAAVA